MQAKEDIFILFLEQPKNRPKLADAFFESSILPVRSEVLSRKFLEHTVHRAFRQLSADFW